MDIELKYRNRIYKLESDDRNFMVYELVLDKDGEPAKCKNGYCKKRNVKYPSTLLNCISELENRNIKKIRC